MAQHRWNAPGQIKRKKPPMDWLSTWAVEHGMEPCWPGNNPQQGKGEFNREALRPRLRYVEVTTKS